VVKTEGYNNQEFVGAGLAFYEFSFTFKAEVPFEFEGWSNGIDLRKVDSTLLKQKIISYFEAYKKLHDQKNESSKSKEHFDQLLREGTSEYWNKKEIKRVYDEMVYSVSLENKEFQPLKNYELAFFGDGKIATLKHSSHLDVDSRLRGQSALYFLFNNKSRARFLGVYLYMDKDNYTGKDEDIQLEMIK
ncbi:hypothetical protein M4I21_03995, partial [Cellulophaga sp. 20_2_10]|uniref:hypothetical protein n=1 Tax=Cellulophaga sp. 20_2_10 TaxID=2942476 RepID=UPI00201AD1D8